MKKTCVALPPPGRPCPLAALALPWLGVGPATSQGAVQRPSGESGGCERVWKHKHTA